MRAGLRVVLDVVPVGYAPGTVPILPARGCHSGRRAAAWSGLSPEPVGDGEAGMRLLIAIAVSAVVLLAAGCSGSSSHPAASPSPLPPDPHTAAALLTIARSFNHDYDTGDYGPVYARWDARSQTI